MSVNENQNQGDEGSRKGGETADSVAGFTPGPWRAVERLSASENHKGWMIFGAQRGIVGEVYPLNQDPTPTARANARLIAAAPALYEAGDSALDVLREMLGTCESDCDCVIHVLEKALALATKP